MEHENYDREKTLAILTGILCVLVFLSGTLLGAYHAITTIGVIAGVLALGCYLILDVVIAWASYIDYRESGNAMEWTAWGVKYPASLYLLVVGGCIAFTMFSGAEMGAAKDSAVARASKAQSDCLREAGNKRGGQAACQKTYQSTLDMESQQMDKKKETDRGGSREVVEAFIGFPLFHYTPGLLGLGGMVALTLVAKLTAKKKDSDDPDGPLFSSGSVRLSRGSQAAPLRVTGRASHSVSNGRGTLSLKRGSIRFRTAGMQEKHVAYVSDADLPSLEATDYESLAKEAVRRRESRHGKDSLCVAIESTL